MLRNIEGKVVNILNANKESIGTGFYIDRNLIVSCYHVLTESYGFEVEQVYIKNVKPADVFTAHLLFYEEERDIVLLRSEKSSLDYFVVDRYSYKENQSCHTYGFPWSGEVDIWSKRMVLDGKNSRTSLYQLADANNITNGFSGAPVWDDYGTLIGIISAKTHSIDERAVNEAFMISVDDLYVFLDKYYTDKKDKKYQSIFEKVISFDESNYLIYNALISKLRNKEVIVPLVGGSLTEYAFGRKECIVDKLCKVLFLNNTQSADSVKKDLLEGEVGVAAWACMEEKGIYQNPMIGFFKDVYKSCTVSDFQTEEEAVALIPYMQYAIRFMQDGILEKVAERRNIGTILVDAGDAKKMQNQKRGLEIYSLCGDLERNVLHSLNSDFKDGGKNYEQFINWIGMNQILYVGVEFEGKTVELCKRLVSEKGNHFALVACGKSEEEKQRKRELLNLLKIDAILYDEQEYGAIESVLHKILVDIQNERFKKRFSRLDFRFSQHGLCGREEEVKILQAFLDSDCDVSNGLPFLWMQLYGAVGSGKSKLVYDFAKSQANRWRLVWVDCNHNEDFFNQIERFTTHLENEWRNVLVVFDDFYLHPFCFEECEPLLKKRNGNKLRLLFVHDTDKTIFYNEDPVKRKHYMVTKYEASPLGITPLDKRTIINICKEYAIYLSNSSVDKLYENKVVEKMDDLEEQIEKVYEECNKTKEVLVLYVCLVRTLKWLGLMDVEDNIQDNVGNVFYYMARQKFVNDLAVDENRIDMIKYLSGVQERNRNKEKPKLDNINEYIPEI